MPVHPHPVGPFPKGKDPESYDRLRRRVLWALPSGLYVLGSRSGDRRNLMTVNWATQLSMEPKLIGACVEKDAVTHDLVAEGGVFTLMTVARDDRAIVRKFVKPVEVDQDSRTLAGYPFHDGLSGAPVLDQALAYLDCQVRQRLDLGSHTLFVGEVTDADFQMDESTPVLRMEDTRMNYGG